MNNFLLLLNLLKTERETKIKNKKDVIAVYNTLLENISFIGMKLLKDNTQLKTKISLFNITKRNRLENYGKINSCSITIDIYEYFFSLNSFYHLNKELTKDYIINFIKKEPTLFLVIILIPYFKLTICNQSNKTSRNAEALYFINNSTSRRVPNFIFNIIEENEEFKLILRNELYSLFNNEDFKFSFKDFNKEGLLYFLSKYSESTLKKYLFLFNDKDIEKINENHMINTLKKKGIRK